jgi:hypothetical protein
MQCVAVCNARMCRLAPHLALVLDRLGLVKGLADHVPGSVRSRACNRQRMLQIHACARCRRHGHSQCPMSGCCAVSCTQTSCALGVDWSRVQSCASLAIQHVV